MSGTSSPTVERVKSGHGHGGPHPPAYGGGGDHGPGDGAPDYEHRLHRARLGLLLGVVSITMLFVTIPVILLLRQANLAFDPQTHSYVQQWTPVTLPVRLLLWNTLILLVSSLTVEMARRSSAREILMAPVHEIAGIAPEKGWRIPWLALTVILGLCFLVGQWMAWNAVRAHGLHIVQRFHFSMTGMNPFFYLLTGAHAMHLAVGILVLLYAGLITLLHSSLEHRRIVIEIAAWYWHFMGVLWIYIFALLQFGH